MTSAGQRPTDRSTAMPNPYRVAVDVPRSAGAPGAALLVASVGAVLATTGQASAQAVDGFPDVDLDSLSGSSSLFSTENSITSLPLDDALLDSINVPTPPPTLATDLVVPPSVSTTGVDLFSSGAAPGTAPLDSAPVVGTIPAPTAPGVTVQAADTPPLPTPQPVDPGTTAEQIGPAVGTVPEAAFATDGGADAVFDANRTVGLAPDLESPTNSIAAPDGTTAPTDPVDTVAVEPGTFQQPVPEGEQVPVVGTEAGDVPPPAAGDVLATADDQTGGEDDPFFDPNFTPKPQALVNAGGVGAVQTVADTAIAEQAQRGGTFNEALGRSWKAGGVRAFVGLGGSQLEGVELFDPEQPGGQVANIATRVVGSGALELGQNAIADATGNPQFKVPINPAGAVAGPLSYFTSLAVGNEVLDATLGENRDPKNPLVPGAEAAKYTFGDVVGAAGAAAGTTLQETGRLPTRGAIGTLVKNSAIAGGLQNGATAVLTNAAAQLVPGDDEQSQQLRQDIANSCNEDVVDQLGCSLGLPAQVPPTGGEGFVDSGGGDGPSASLFSTEDPLVDVPDGGVGELPPGTVASSDAGPTLEVVEDGGALRAEVTVASSDGDPREEDLSVVELGQGEVLPAPVNADGVVPGAGAGNTYGVVEAGSTPLVPNPDEQEVLERVEAFQQVGEFVEGVNGPSGRVLGEIVEGSAQTVGGALQSTVEFVEDVVENPPPFVPVPGNEGVFSTE